MRARRRGAGLPAQPDRTRTEDQPLLHDRRADPRHHQSAVPADPARHRGPAGRGRLHAVDRQHRQRPQRERNDIEAMRARQVDGFITATARLDHELLDGGGGATRRSCSSTDASRTPRCRRSRPTTRGRPARGRAPRRARPHADRRTSAVRRISRPVHAPRGLRRRDDRGGSRARGRCRFGVRSPSTKALACATSCSSAGGGDRDRGGQRPDGARLLRRAGGTRAAVPRATSRSSASTTCRSPSASTRR